MMRTGVAPVWRLRRSSEVKDEVIMPLTPRLVCDAMIALKQAAIAGLGVGLCPGWWCRSCG
jgi:DNA-binding transcriptional LysR family regulator